MVGGGPVTSGRLQKTASRQNLKKPPGPPSGTPDKPAGEGQKRKTSQQTGNHNSADHNGQWRTSSRVLRNVKLLAPMEDREPPQPKPKKK